MVGTVLLDTNVFTAWLKPRSSLVPLYGKHVFGRRVAVASQTVAEARYGALIAGWGDKRLDSMERLIRRSRPLTPDDETAWEYARLRAACRKIGHPLHQKQHVGDLWIAGRRSAGICLLLPTMPSSSAVRSSTYALNWRSQARDSLSRGEDRSSLVA